MAGIVCNVVEIGYGILPELLLLFFFAQGAIVVITLAYYITRYRGISMLRIRKVKI